MLKNAVPSAQEKCFSITKSNRLVLFRELKDILFRETYETHANGLWTKRRAIILKQMVVSVVTALQKQ
jgi:hypothetical protein